MWVREMVSVFNSYFGLLGEVVGVRRGIRLGDVFARFC